MNPESIFLKCECCCNVIEVEYDPEVDQFYTTVWESSAGHKPLTKKERIRWCEHVMKTGRPWADHTIVNKQNARRLVKFLTKYLDHGKAKRRKAGRT